MHAVEAMAILSKTKKRKEEYVPVPFDHVKNSGLTLHEVVRNQNDEPILCKVKRLEFIKWLETSYQLFPKRAELLNVLRSSLRK